MRKSTRLIMGRPIASAAMAFGAIIAASVLGTFIAAAAPDSPVPSQDIPQSRAYRGYLTDIDMGAFVRQYPDAAGSRLDDCQTCHRAGVPGTDTARILSPCGYCHLLVFPNSRFESGVPETYEATLNPFGLDYKRAGRTTEALWEIEDRDSDGDGAPNGDEIAQLRYPGDSASRPGQPLAPFRVFEPEELAALPAHSQFMLLNKPKDEIDEYVLYRGVKVADLLAAAGVSLESALGITVFAPDGYGIDFAIEDIMKPFPPGRFYTAPRTAAEFLRISPLAPSDLHDGMQIPGEAWLILAYERDGGPLDVSIYESGTGRLAGEGPFRLIRPDRVHAGSDPSRPGRPDRSNMAEPVGDGWDYDPKLDHSAEDCVRAACVIRVNPVPSGYEEYDYKNGWPLVEGRKVVIFGQGVTSSPLSSPASRAAGKHPGGARQRSR